MKYAPPRSHNHRCNRSASHLAPFRHAHASPPDWKMDCVGRQGFGSFSAALIPNSMRKRTVDTKAQRITQSFRRVGEWQKSRDGILQSAPAPVHVHFTALREVVTRIEANAILQASQHGLRTRSATDANVRRAAVRDAMRPIAQVARTLQGSVLGIGAIALMPQSHWDNEKLVTAANSMAENATVFAKVLIDHGLQPDCIETLTAAAAALKSSIDARGTAKATAIGARDGVRAGLREGQKLVSLLDASLTSLLKADPVNLASWRNAKRITVKGVFGIYVPAASAETAPSSTASTSDATRVA